ncbi:MAG: hypothetical protein IKH18_06465 [Clostridia bacterium]|nr:hypothetical protein [Clostridia bacterium]
MKTILRQMICLTAALILCMTAFGAGAEKTEAAYGLAGLTADTVLFYRQADVAARTGTLVPLSEVLSAGPEQLFPRTHLYDAEYEGTGIFPQLTDYCLGMGYAGYSVLKENLPDLRMSQKLKRANMLVYRIDTGDLRILTDGGEQEYVTVLLSCPLKDTMEKFSAALAKAREIAASVPPELDDYEKLRRIDRYLRQHTVYGDRDRYYLRDWSFLYDALVKEVCVCTGYAEAMYFLCGLCGVECIRVEGMADDPEGLLGLSPHAWNIAEIGGGFYLFDETANAMTPEGEPGMFALSAKTMAFFGTYSMTGDYANNPLIPECPVNYDPAAAWNGTPAGALRSWLWFAAYAEHQPVFLAVASGVTEEELMKAAPGPDGLPVIPHPFEDFRAWALTYMTEECFEEHYASEFPPSADGGIAFRARPESQPVRRCAGEAVCEDGVYTAGVVTDDGAEAKAVFTVEETDGRYRIADIRFEE